MECGFGGTGTLDRQPSEEDLRAAMLETVEVFRQGRLTEDELKWVLSLLSAQTINLKFERLLLNFWRRFSRSTRFDAPGAQYNHSSRRTLRNRRLSRV